MKKITFAIAAMAMFAFAACTNETATSSEDSAKQAQAVADSLAKLAPQAPDTMPKTVDTGVKVETPAKDAEKAK